MGSGHCTLTHHSPIVSLQKTCHPLKLGSTNTTKPEAEFFDVSPKSFPPCYSQSPLRKVFPPPPPPSCKSGLKLVCNVNIVYRNLTSRNSQDYTQKPQRNCTFMNSASILLNDTPKKLTKLLYSDAWVGYNTANARKIILFRQMFLHYYPFRLGMQIELQPWQVDTPVTFNWVGWAGFIWPTGHVPNTVHILRVERDILCECLVERLSSIVPLEFSAGDGSFWKKEEKNNRREDLQPLWKGLSNHPCKKDYPTRFAWRKRSLDKPWLGVQYCINVKNFIFLYPTSPS